MISRSAPSSLLAASCAKIGAAQNNTASAEVEHNSVREKFIVIMAPSPTRYAVP
jgi:hypothetical protein